jgi:ABC-type Fe3+ transport system substrate-binding protein
MLGRPGWSWRWASALALIGVVACAGAPSASSSPRAPTTPLGVASPSGEAANSGLQRLIDSARREGSLSFVWGEGTLGGTESLRRLTDGFNRTYGLNLDVKFTPGPSMSEMSPRIVQESQANRPASTDVLIGYDSQIAPAIQAGALEPVDWLSWAPNIRDPALVAPNGMAVTIETATPGITYNSSRLTGDAVPRSLQDLLKPQYNGHLASTPYAANFDRLSTDELWGEPRTWDFLTQYAEQLGGLMRCNEMDRLLSGEFDAFALDCSQSNALATRAKGAPLAFVIPSDAPLLLAIYLAVPGPRRTPTLPSSGSTICSAARPRTCSSSSSTWTRI